MENAYPVEELPQNLGKSFRCDACGAYVLHGSFYAGAGPHKRIHARCYGLRKRGVTPKAVKEARKEVPEGWVSRV